MSDIQRFKAALTTGVWNDNPESLVRDDSGDYVLFSDYQTIEAKIKELESERDLLEKRLQFLNFYSAKICHTNDCEYCYVAWDYEEDSFSTPLMNTMEEAIDAAILIAKSPKGE